MWQKLLNWIDYHRGAWWVSRCLAGGWTRRDVRVMLSLIKANQAYRDGALDALGGREMAR